MEFGKVRPTLGYDIDATRIEELLRGKDRTLEVNEESLAEASQLVFSCDQEELRNCQIFIVTVPTPIDG